MNQSVVPAQRADVPAIAAIHRDAFPATFMTGLGARFLASYYAGLASSQTGLLLVAHESEAVVGFAAGDTRAASMYADLVRSRLRIGATILPAILRHPRVIGHLLRAAANAQRRAEAIEPNVAELSSLAVAPGWQGRGLGGRMLEHFCQRAREAGANRIRVRTPAQGNDAVLAFYQNHDFERESTYRDGPNRPMLALGRGLG